MLYYENKIQTREEQRYISNWTTWWRKMEPAGRVQILSESLSFTSDSEKHESIFFYLWARIAMQTGFRCQYRKGKTEFKTLEMLWEAGLFRLNRSSSLGERRLWIENQREKWWTRNVHCCYGCNTYDNPYGTHGQHGYNHENINQSPF